MTERPLKNVAASVRQRLMNSAKASGRPFQEVLQYFAMERFLYRLSQSPHAERFILKGALLFNLWGAPSSRPTRDIDLLGRLNNSVDALVPVFRDVCQLAVEPDGLVFAVETVAGQPIKEDADYSGVRVTFQASLENARVPMQIDIGFGDTVVPDAAFADYPTILDHAQPRLRAYPKETVVAEKFEAMVKLGQLNSRLKDFFDLWLLSRQFEFDGRLLSEAITRTFENRKTAMSAVPIALTAAFANDPIKQRSGRDSCESRDWKSRPPTFPWLSRLSGISCSHWQRHLQQAKGSRQVGVRPGRGNPNRNDLWTSPGAALFSLRLSGQSNVIDQAQSLATPTNARIARRIGSASECQALMTRDKS